jgi:hypothetical protein
VKKRVLKISYEAAPIRLWLQGICGLKYGRLQSFEAGGRRRPEEVQVRTRPIHRLEIRIDRARQLYVGALDFLSAISRCELGATDSRPASRPAISSDVRVAASLSDSSM